MIFNSAAFIGGDKRQLFAAWALARKGFKVYLGGFDRLISYGSLIIGNYRRVSRLADIIVLPVTGAKNGAVPAYFSAEEIKLDKEFIESVKDKPVFAGKSATLPAELTVFDLLKRGDFAVRNALPTAEGAVQLAMENFEGTVAGSRCLVIGYGRIGTALSRMLRALNAEVSVASSNAEKFAQIGNDGNRAVKTSEINSLNGFDIVFNTADAVIIDKNVLQNTSDSPVIIDLATSDGVDFAAAEELGFTAIKGSALPGKCSPKTAGEIISDTILTILEEEYSWQKRI